VNFDVNIILITRPVFIRFLRKKVKIKWGGTSAVYRLQESLWFIRCECVYV